MIATDAVAAIMPVDKSKSDKVPYTKNIFIAITVTLNNRHIILVVLQ